MTKLQVKRLRDDAKLPVRANPTDAGFDVFSAVDCTIYPGDVVRVPTGIAVHPVFAADMTWATNRERDEYGKPGGWTLACIVHDKSSLGGRGLKVMGGVIDDPYTGELFVVLGNYWTRGKLDGIAKVIDALLAGTASQWFSSSGESGAKVAKGDKIANLLVQRVELPEVEEVNALEATARGGGGFGSTGH